MKTKGIDIVVSLVGLVALYFNLPPAVADVPLNQPAMISVTGIIIGVGVLVFLIVRRGWTILAPIIWTMFCTTVITRFF